MFSSKAIISYSSLTFQFEILSKHVHPFTDTMHLIPADCIFYLSAFDSARVSDPLRKAGRDNPLFYKT